MTARRSVAGLVALSAVAFGGARVGETVTLAQDDGYRGIWYFNQPSGDEYRYKYSGGLGTYCAKHIPLAIYSKEAKKTFFVYGGTSKGQRNLLEMVSYFDHSTGTVPRPRILHDKQTDDAHDNPVLCIDGEGHLWVFCSAHGTARPAFIYRSVRPYDISQFELIAKTNFSYPQPWFVQGKGLLFLHTLYRNGRILHWSTSPDGRSWTKPRRLAAIAQGHYQVSWRHGRKVGTAFNYHPVGKGLNWRTNLYYLETDDFGSTWRNIRREAVQTPLTEVRNGALVRDYEKEGWLVYLKDLNFDSRGRPLILYLRSRSYRAGPQKDGRIWTVAHWAGDRWEFRDITTSDSNYDTGCLHVEPDGTWRLIAPTEVGPQPFNPGGEVAMWVSNDEGRTWRKVRQLTTGSEFNHTYCRRPVDAHPGFYAFWADGHGRRPSESRLYFCDRQGNVFRLPAQMSTQKARPEPVRSP